MDSRLGIAAEAARARERASAATPGLDACRASLATHSKSFALAARLLPRASADRAAAVYAWCRRADDAVDEVPPAQQPAALARLAAELDAIWSGHALEHDPELATFAAVVRDCRIPRIYAEELVRGMQMDTDGTRYATLEELVGYAFRVAGTVGLMMCHVMTVADRSALRRAAHLGIAMQLTNVARDVLEDWHRGRLYVPDELLAAHGAASLRGHLGGSLPPDARAPLAAAVAELLHTADDFYASGDAGLAALPWRAAFSVRTARLVYSAIGRRIEAQGCDVLAGRAVVPGRAKLALAALAALRALVEAPARARTCRRAVDLAPPLRFPDDVLPLSPNPA